MNSGNCTLITNAVVSHVDMDNADNKASGVTYVDRVTRQVKQVRGKAVILCAQALESTRILLNSSTREYPEWPGQFERRARTLFDGPCTWGRRYGRLAGLQNSAERK